MNSIAVVDDKILLHWDGSLPKALLDKAAPLDKFLDPAVNHYLIPQHWSNLAGYCTWSPRHNAFRLNVSVQNLMRLYAEFGLMPVAAGQDKIDRLKERRREHCEMVARAKDIKDGKVEMHIPYKVAPLAEYQHRAAMFLTETARAPLFADCGLGKTWAVLVSTEEQIRRQVLGRGKTLVCGKLATLETGWLDDAKKFTDLSAKLLWLPACSRRREKIVEMMREPADIYIINHEGLRVFKDELIQMGFEKVVVDESTILKGFVGNRSTGGVFGKALMEVSHNARWRVIMSGTPAPNAANDLWGQMHFLDPDGFCLEPDYADFKARFMDEIRWESRPGLKAGVKPILKPGAAEAISELVMPLAFRAKIRDHLKQLPEKTVIRRYGIMRDEQKDHYESMKEMLSTEIANEFVSVESKLTQMMKLRQITGGFLIDQKENAHEIKDQAKIKLLDDLVNSEIGRSEKIIIYCQYQYEIRFILDRYKKLGVVTVYGGNASAQNLENIKSFINRPEVKIIVLHPKSAAHGLTFTHCHYMIFYSISFSAEDDYQCVKRIERAGQKHPMFIYYLLAKNEAPGEMTIDQIIFQVLQAKTKTQDKLIADRDVATEIYTELRKLTNGCQGKNQAVSGKVLRQTRRVREAVADQEKV